MSDIWSLGCIFAYIFTGKPLFRSENKSEIELLSEIFYLAGTPDVPPLSPRSPTGPTA
jgi:serine/threonine protein kinase